MRLAASLAAFVASPETPEPYRSFQTGAFRQLFEAQTGLIRREREQEMQKSSQRMPRQLAMAMAATMCVCATSGLRAEEGHPATAPQQIGRASCRARVCQ